MAKTQKEKSVTKDRLAGMTVVDGTGTIIGTVKDIGFTVGKTGISLSVEDKNGDLQEIPWDEVQGAGDFVVLKVVTPAATSTTSATTVPGRCPICGGPLTYIPQYQRWYCYKDQKYV